MSVQNNVCVSQNRLSQVIVTQSNINKRNERFGIHTDKHTQYVYICQYTTIEHICIHTYIYIHAFVYKCVYIYTYIQINICIHVCMHIYIYIHTYI